MSQQEDIELAEFLDLAEGLVKHTSTHRLETEYFGEPSMEPDGSPYFWQVEFHNNGKHDIERLIMAANRVGKSRTAGAEGAIHATGMYPEWWDGKRFDGPTNGMACIDTNEQSRSVTQKILLGEIQDGVHAPDGTGWIPLDRIIKVTFRQCGVTDVIDTVWVRHVSGGVSTIRFMSYDMTWVKFQGVMYDWVWFDEEPRDTKIYYEALMRTLDSGGIAWMSRTPLYGMTQIISSFVNAQPGDKVSLVNATWDDAPHIPRDRIEHMKSRLPPHELEAKAMGLPMLGSGAIYTGTEADVTIDDFGLPGHFRQIKGIDFGIGHPFGRVRIAFDPDNDIIYVVSAEKQADNTAADNAQLMNADGGKTIEDAEWIPIAWPHDGHKRESIDAKTIADTYRDKYRCNMLEFSARYDDETGGSQSTEPVIMEIQERESSGRIKYFKSLDKLLMERRMYHRKDGKIVRENDDLLSALHYAVMMLRFADVRRHSFQQTEAVQDWDED